MPNRATDFHTGVIFVVICWFAHNASNATCRYFYLHSNTFYKHNSSDLLVITMKPNHKKKWSHTRCMLTVLIVLKWYKLFMWVWREKERQSWCHSRLSISRSSYWLFQIKSTAFWNWKLFKAFIRSYKNVLIVSEVLIDVNRHTQDGSKAYIFNF
jgi:hypothetical protein